MRYRPDVVLLAVSLGLLGLIVVAFFLIGVGIIPGGILMLDLVALPAASVVSVALVLAVAAASVYCADRNISRRIKK